MKNANPHLIHPKHLRNATARRRASTQDSAGTSGPPPAASTIRTSPRDFVNPVDYRHPYDSMGRFAKALALRYDANRTRHCYYRQVSGGQAETPARSMSCRRTRPVRRPDPRSRSVRAGPALSVLSAPHALGRSLPSAVPSKGASGGSTPSPFHPSGSVRRAKTTFHRVSQGGSPSRGGRIGRPSVDHSMPLGHFDCCGRRPRQQAESGRPVRTRFAVGGGCFTASPQVPPKVR
jgi:hypothetical protein